jgi:hypothetical protein
MFISPKQQNTQGTISLTITPFTFTETEEFELIPKDSVIRKNDVLKGIINTKYNLGELIRLKFVQKNAGLCIFNCVNDVIFNKIRFMDINDKDIT